MTLEDTLDAEQAAFRALSGGDRGAHTRRLEGQLDALLTEVGRGGGLLCISVLFFPHLAPSLTFRSSFLHDHRNYVPRLPDGSVW